MSAQPAPRKVIPITPQPAVETESGSLFEAHQKVYPRTVKGRYTNWRWALVWLTQAIFYGLPWLTWNGRQAIVFDLAARKFYLFDLVLLPQDFIFLTGLLVISALSLFLFTAIGGRLWCGYACPQTVYTEIFLWIERRIEGDRPARMKLDAAPWTARKLFVKSSKQVAWIALALWTGFTFVGYFTPIHILAGEVASFTVGGWEAFWIFFYGFATYGNAGYLREQVCKHMCPYARFQGAMFDKDTLVITYDAQRGEPRGSRRRSGPVSADLGSCINCSICVQVCPTGIDIREGLQIGCIGCAACIDACDDVMDKMRYPRGLIRYATERSMAEGGGRADIWRHVLRARTVIYGAVLCALVAALSLGLWLRQPFKVDLVRDRGTLGRIVEGGMVENTYRMHLVNATEIAQRYVLNATGIDGLVIDSIRHIELAPAQGRSFAVRLRAPAGSSLPGSTPIEFQVIAEQGGRVDAQSVFLTPR